MYKPELPEKRLDFLKIMEGFTDKPISGDLEHIYKAEPKDALQGLLGNALMRHITPENMDIDFLEHMFRFRPNKKMDISLGQEGKTNFLNLGWKF